MSVTAARGAANAPSAAAGAAPRPDTKFSPTQVLQQLEQHIPARTRRRPRRGVATQAPTNPVAVTVLRILVVALVFGGWEAGTRTGVIDIFFWSSPSQIWDKAIQQATAGSLWGDLLFTLTSALTGFVLGTVLGIALGLSFWWSKTYGKTVEPFVVMFEAIPKLALAPIVVLVLGIGIESKIAMATAMVMAVQALNASAGVRTVDGDIVRMMYSLGASRGKVFRSVVIPSTLPWIISGLRVTIGLALAGAIVGEFIGSQQGLGRLIVYAGSVYDIALIWVGVFVLAALSIVLYLLVGAAEKRLAGTVQGR